MYICPICAQEYTEEVQMSKHLLKCWRANNPNQKSKAAPCSADQVQYDINIDAQNFFDNLKG